MRASPVECKGRKICSTCAHAGRLGRRETEGLVCIRGSVTLGVLWPVEPGETCSEWKRRHARAGKSGPE